jgi:hypothetical protein
MCRVSKTSFWLNFMYRGPSNLERQSVCKSFFECSDIFIIIYSSWDSCAYGPGLYCKPSACAQKRGNWPITASFGEGAIWSGWKVKKGHLEHLWAYWAFPLPLSHSYWLGLHFSEIEIHLVHCIKLLIFEALYREIIKWGRWLVTLGGCRLLDGLVVVPRELFKGDCEEAAVVIVRGVVLASPEWWKATLVESRFEDSLTNTAQEIKWTLDRGAVGCFESTSTWTRGDQQVIDTTGKKTLCPVSSSPCWFATFLTSLYLLVHILMLVSIWFSYMLLYI